MYTEKNILLEGRHGKPVVADISYSVSIGRMPVVIYAHGFNGFKDWGNFDLVSAHFAELGFVFIKFNFSHNGTTPEQPEDFADLEAFSNNNYTKQLDDLGTVIDWALSGDNPHSSVINKDKLYIIGHSMGGAIAIIKAAEDDRVKKLVTWASVSECKTPWGKWPQDRMAQWEQQGVAYYENTRTSQQMPMKYQLYTDYHENKERLDIQRAMNGLDIPVLICHGTEDASVPVVQAEQLHAWRPGSSLYLVDSDHVFGRKHPWASAMPPAAMQAVMSRTVEFLKM